MTIERLVCIGVNHQSAPLDLREQLSQWPTGDLRTDPIEELVILSTCNRLELYALLSASALNVLDPAERFQPLLDLVARAQGVNQVQLACHLYAFSGEAVAEHLCRVAAGLDSIVMGEGQILGQVNKALQDAYRNKSIGQGLALLFRTAITAGKRARTETRISANPVSISAAAVALATQKLGDLRTKRVAVVGLGEMGQLALKGLAGRGVTDLLLVNRTRSRAETLAAKYGGQVFGLEQLAIVLQRADVVITATSAIAPLIDQRMLRAAMAVRGARPLLLIDLAVPRNIASLGNSSVRANTTSVMLFDVDDMRSVVDDAFAARQAEIPHVNQIIAEVLAGWRAAAQALQLRPVVVGLRQQAEQMRQQAVERTLRHLERQQGTVDEATAAQLTHLSRALVNQLLHRPTVTLKEKSQQDDGVNYAALVCELFGLDIPLPNDDEQFSFSLNWLLTDEAGASDDRTLDEAAPLEFYHALPSINCSEQYELVGQP